MPPNQPAPVPLPTLPVGLAPMEGVTIFPARLFFHLASAPTTLATPFLRVTATYPHRELPPGHAPELGPVNEAVPYQLVPQMMATEAGDFLKASAFYPETVPFLELNAGCPSPTCVGKGAGSSLLADAEAFHRTVECLSERLGPSRFAVKMRTGFRDAGEFPTLVQGMANLPLARLTVHGRTRPDGYHGKARWDLIALAAAGTTAPVVASGDVVDARSFRALLAAAPGLAGVIVGRGAMRNPWIFEELRTGRPVTLSPRVLTLALTAFAALHDLYAEKLDDLILLTGAGTFWASAGTDEGAWETVAKTLLRAAYGTDRDLHVVQPLSRQTLGRVKMLWNYVRSSLPAAFFEPSILRHKDLGALLQHIGHVARSSGATSLELRHDPTRDWIYSGAKRDQADADPRQVGETSCLVQATSQARTKHESARSPNAAEAGSARGSSTSGML